MTLPTEADINEGSPSIFSFLMGYAAGAWERIKSVNGALLVQSAQPLASTPAILIPAGTALPAAGAPLTGIPVIPIPAGASVAVIYVPSYANGSGGSGGNALITALVGFIVGGAANTAIYRPEGGTGAISGIASAAFGCAIYVPIPPGATRFSAASSETGDVPHPGTFTADVTVYFA